MEENRQPQAETTSCNNAPQNPIQTLLQKNEPLFLDGAFGTMLQSKGITPGTVGETLNFTKPDWVLDIHKAYLKAGSRILMTNTFGCSPFKLEGCGYTPKQVIEQAVSLARQAIAEEGLEGQAFVALDIGPLGQMMKPAGTLSFEQAYDIFTDLVKAGEEAGTDLVGLETFSDLQEMRAAMLAVKENSSLPLFATMSMEADGRTFMGVSLESMAMTMAGLKPDAMGFNCSTGPDKASELVKGLSELVDIPIIIKPNAGLPDPVTSKYEMDADTFARWMEVCRQNGASVFGGCCGTTPVFIETMVKALQDKPLCRKHPKARPGICSPSKAVFVDTIQVIGERINPAGKKALQKALLEGDLDPVLKYAIEQQEAGADILDVNVGCPGVDEEVLLPLAVEKIQEITDLPLQLDSSNPQALEKALRIYCGKASVNSVNASEKSLEAILPLAARYGASVVGLTLDESGLPENAKQRISLAHKIADRARGYGLDKSDVWFDTLTLTVSAQQEQALETLDALRQLSKEGYPTVLGVSNISFGLPDRALVTRTFLSQALACGLRLPIINPCSPAMMNTVWASRMLLNQDEGCRNYMENIQPESAEPPAGSQKAGTGSQRTENGNTAKSSGKETNTGMGKETSGGCSCGCTHSADSNHADRSPAANADFSSSADAAQNALYESLRHAILRGLKSQAAAAARDILSFCPPLDLVEGHLIPALDEVGRQYEEGKMYLPSLLSAAGAAQAVFEILKEEMSRRGEAPVIRGEIIMATVKGDVHDIGKNIVKTVLENYGYRIVDLGKDVDPDVVVQSVLDNHISLVGLSALMTTTLPAMEETIRKLKQLDNPPKIMVGGAVVTPEYAKSVGADFYCKDARESVLAAGKVFEG